MYHLLTKEKLKNADNAYHHPSYVLENQLLDEIKLGLLNEAFMTLHKINEFPRAQLAPDPIRSIKNSLIGSCTLFARAALEANPNYEDVFSLSDLFIKRIESLQSEQQLNQLEFDMAKGFIRLVHQAHIAHHSKPVTQMITTIHEKLYETLNMEKLSTLTHKSPDYLSRLFKQEVGMTITQYINQQKIDDSKRLLSYTDMKISDIAEMYDFCNPGYYAKLFKKIVGCTPDYYRKYQKKREDDLL